jgi:PAS domain S-box-containing protein
MSIRGRRIVVRDIDKTREQLIVEVGLLRARVAELSACKLDGIRAEAAMREAQAKRHDLERIINLSPAVVWLWKNTKGWPVEFVSDNVCLFGYQPEDFMSSRMTFADIIHPDDFDTFRITVDKYAKQLERDSFAQEYRIKTLDGRSRWVDDRTWMHRRDSGDIVHYYGVLIDITERKMLEEQLLQSQKLESIGLLAGGVAHDFNNNLQTMKGYMGFVLEEMNPSEKYFTDLLEVDKGIDKVTSLTKQLLAFSRRQVLHPEDINLNDLVNSLLKMFRRVIPEDIQIDFLPGPALKIIHVDPVQIEQVLMNLCVNARDAMHQGGVLSIETKNISIEAGFCREQAWAKEGEYVLFSVSDTGCGMDPDTKMKIFEPFFTTKELGKGTGLGMATVYGIVKQHDGLISVCSEKDKGTKIEVYFKVVENRVNIAEDVEDELVEGGSEIIVVAEDDEMLRKLTARILEEAGYSVLQASNGSQATEIISEHSGEISLALIDAVMPGMSGREVFEEINRIDPDVKILFSSGYGENTDQTNFIKEENLQFIQKPHAPKTLLRRIRKVLELEEE